jgi:nucleoside-diphosphate-sugar epimerase
LIDLARTRLGECNVKFIFTSSISTAQSWDQSIGPYPEELVMDPKYAVGMGYGESKYVTERVSHLSFPLNHTPGRKTDNLYVRFLLAVVLMRHPCVLGRSRAIRTALGLRRIGFLFW